MRAAAVRRSGARDEIAPGLEMAARQIDPVETAEREVGARIAVPVEDPQAPIPRLCCPSRRSEEPGLAGEGGAGDRAQPPERRALNAGDAPRDLLRPF